MYDKGTTVSRANGSLLNAQLRPRIQRSEPETFRSKAEGAALRSDSKQFQMGQSLKLEKFYSTCKTIG